MADFTGNDWYKCDLHIHTMTSECYIEKSDTPEMWVDRCIEQGLNVCAVTDHNDYRGISGIMEAAKDRPLVVFPGVEITCDSSKIHMLILFDTNRTAETVRDFLNRCDIDSEMVGSSDGTSMSVSEVCQIAKKRGAMVIAAHIDEFNAISSMNPANLDKFLQSGLIDAVQTANAPIWRKYWQDKDVDAMNTAIREKYGPDATPELIDAWRKCYDRAVELRLPMLSFSDNQASPEESKHGLWGIGSVYTWIQMDDHVDLESLRQALITPESRICMMFDSIGKPKTEPDFWIRSIEVRNTSLNPHQPIHLDFHPQLNCIIGGRGSGKSSVVRLLSGVYGQLEEGLLSDSIASEEKFYKKIDENGRGIFLDDSEIEIRFKWYGLEYRLCISDIQNCQHQTRRFYLIDTQSGEETEELVTENGFHSLMSAQVFLQRQVYEIAATPGALLERVDMSIPDLVILKAQRDHCFNRILILTMEIHTEEMLQKQEDQIIAEKDWLDRVLNPTNEVFEDSGKRAGAIALRSDALEKIEDSRRRLEADRKELDECRREYNEIAAKISKERTDFLNYVLRDDENYKMEIRVGSSRESFREILRKTLKVEEHLIQDDIRILEDKLFSKGNEREKYEALLHSARNREDNPFSAYFQHLICSISGIDFVRLVYFHPEDELLMYYHPNGIKRFFPMTNASAGERAAAVLAFVLFNSSWPLVIDQPEDDLDNRIIYDELVAKLKRAKKKRQMIIVTHNANITTNADAEMIISMDPWSKFTKVRLAGSMDSTEIRKEICDVLEGSETAFIQRSRKYHFD